MHEGLHRRKANQALPIGSFEHTFVFVACMDAGKGRDKDAEALLDARLVQLGQKRGNKSMLKENKNRTAKVNRPYIDFII